MILTYLECLATLEKVKEMMTWSKSLFFKDTFHIIGVASGNTVSVLLTFRLEGAEYDVKVVDTFPQCGSAQEYSTTFFAILLVNSPEHPETPFLLSFYFR